jgi:outer membrane protein OmpA-like peptidoglycan-associated protein
MLDSGDEDVGLATATALTVAVATSFLAVGIALWLALTGPSAGGGRVPQIQTNVYFTDGQAVVDIAGLGSLLSVASAADSNPDATVVIAVYFRADAPDPQRETDLAARRAASVQAILESSGLARERIVVLRPIAAMQSIDQRQTRRVSVSFR